MTRHAILLAATGAALLAGLTVRADYPSEVLSRAPINYWRLNEAGPVPQEIFATNSGSFGPAGNGSYIGVIRKVPGAIVSDPDNTGIQIPNANGGSGGAARVRIPWQADLNANAAFSVEFWAKPAITSAIACPASSTDFNTTPRYGWLFYQGPGGLGDGNGWYFRIIHSAGNSYAAVGLAIDTNHWYHVVGTYDGVDKIKLYVDGAPVATTTMTGAYTPNVNRTDVPMTFGGRADGVAGNYGWGGMMDEAAYYTKALSDAEVADHYQAGISPTPALPYATVVKNSQPAVYLRLDQDNYTPLMAVNSGTRGTAANGIYSPSVVIAPGLRPPTFPTLEAGNNAGLLDGATGSIDCGTASSMDGTNDFTVMAFVRTTATGTGTIAQQRTVDSATVTGYNGEYKIWMAADGLVHFMLYKDGYQFDFATGVAINDGNWHQVVAQRKGLDGYLYIDGVLQGSATGTEVKALVGNITTYIGRDMRDFIDPWLGEIDEVAIFDKALGVGAIQSLYYTATGASEGPVMASDPPVVEPVTTIYATTTFTITADIAGSLPMTYLWRRNGTPVGTDRDYVKTNASTSDTGDYDVVVQNAYGSVTSATVHVQVDAAQPPSVTRQPASRPVYLGGTARFTVEAAGTTPLSYQWRKAGVDIAGATSNTLVLSNVAAADAASYTVRIANVAGSIVSSGATLTLRTPAAGTQEAATVAAGPIAYWRFNEAAGATTAFDYAGGRDGLIVNNVALGGAAPTPPEFPGFEAGNTAFEFDGTDADVELSSIGLAGPISVCAWVKPNALSGDRAIAGENASWALKLTGSEIRFTTPGILDHQTSGANVQAGLWQHVAATFVPGAAGGARFYLNGKLVGTATASALTKGNSTFWIGKNQWAGQVFDGALDEIAVFDKLLAAETIDAIYSAAAYGSVTAPIIKVQPTAQVAVVGSTATLSVSAGGSLPLTYQWKKNGTAIAGATTATLTIANAAFIDAGSYSVSVANTVATKDSAAATLTVVPAPTFANLTNGLVLHLKFDGNYADSSGLNNNADAPAGALPFIAGKVGQAVHVETTPSANYLVVSDPMGSFSFSETANFTLSFWIKYTSRFNDVPIIGNAVNSTYQLGWVFTDEGGKIECSLVSTANSGTYVADPVAGSPQIDNGAWHHIVGVVDRDALRATVYVDGAFAGGWSLDGLGTLDTGYPITIGQDPNGAYGSATFDLDDLGMWNRALTAYEALSIYNAASGAGQSFDVYGPVQLTLTPDGRSAIVAWQAGTLEASDSLGNTASWKAVAGAVAPVFTVPTATGVKFYRIRL
jgi:hypothetical protein